MKMIDDQQQQLSYILGKFEKKLHRGRFNTNQKILETIERLNLHFPEVFTTVEI
jgi:hypothetical protein